jgi:uncharacterized protein YuzE
MKLGIDVAADALHLQWVDVDVIESEEVASGVLVDYDASGEVVGVGILCLSKRPHPVDISVFRLQTHRKPKNENSSSHIAV